MSHINRQEWGAFVAQVDKIEPDAVVLVEKNLARLLPAGVKQGPYVDHLDYVHPWVVPDRRVNPATANYILARDYFDLRTILYGPSPVWSVVAAGGEQVPPMVYLLRRSQPIGRQLAPELTDEAARAGQRDMVRIEWPAKLPTVHHPRPYFYVHRFEITHELYARFLNDIDMPPEQANIYYSLNDPTSRIVYHNGRYRTYRGSERLPVYNVSWYGAQAFCEHYGQRLLEWMEWLKITGYEDDQRPYPWGHQKDITRRANFQGNGDGYLFWAPVDAFPEGVSPYGLYNLAGNVAEWIEREMVAGGAFELGPETGLTNVHDMNYALARNLHDGFRCASDQEPR